MDQGCRISKFGLLAYRVQVDFIWNRHIDQLIQPKAGEVIEDLLLQPRQTLQAVELVLANDYLYSPPQAKDYPKSSPQAKSEQTQTREPVLEATSAKDLPDARKQAVKSAVKPPQRYPQSFRKPAKRLIEEA